MAFKPKSLVLGQVQESVIDPLVTRAIIVTDYAKLSFAFLVAVIVAVVSDIAVMLLPNVHIMEHTCTSIPALA